MTNEHSNFATNLGDGEIKICLPSQVFFKDVPSKCKHHLYHHHPPVSSMDDLVQRLSAFTLPNMPNPPKANNFEKLIRYGSMNATGNEVSRSLHGCKPSPFLGGTKPAYEVQFLKPAKARVRIRSFLV